MTNYRIFSNLIKNNTKKTFKNVNISKNNNEFFKNNKEPPLNISIMDPDFSKNF